MENPHQNQSSYQVLKRAGIASGTLRIIEVKRPRDGREARLVFFIEIETSDKENEKIIKIISEELELQLFNAPAQTLEFAFENALAKANLGIKDTLLAKPKNWLNKIHILAMAADDQEMHISTVGNIHAFLIHRDKVVDVVNAQPASLAASGRESLFFKTPNPVKLFSNIITGRLLPNDAMVIVNESVLDYLSLERIRKTAQDYAPAGSLEKFRELLNAAPANKQFGFYIIKRLSRLSRAARPEAAAVKPASGISEKFLEEEPATTPGRFARPNDMKTMAGSFWRRASPVLSRAAQLALSFLLKGLSQLLEKILEQLTKLGDAISHSPPIIKSLWRDASARRYYRERFTGQARQKWQQAARSFKNMPGRKKNILLATVILCLLFLGSVAARVRSQTQTKNQTAIEKLRAEITQKIDQAEASLIYKDETHSRTLLKEAAGRLPALGRESGLAGKIQDLLNRLDKRVALAEFEVMAVIAPPESYENTGLALLGEDIYYYNGAQQKIAKVNQADKTVAPLAVAGLESFVRARPYDQQTLLAVGAKTVGLVNVKNSSLAAKPLALEKSTNYAFTTYARNLYALAGVEKTLVRFRENAYARAETWLKQPYDLSRTVDLAVDGALYLLKNNGDIAIFLSGSLNREIRWPPSDAPGTDISFYTTADLDALYVLDPNQERLVVIGKDGILRSQFTSPQLRSSRSFLVDAHGQDLYILAQDAILRVTLQ